MASVDHRSAAEIEREIEAERGALTRTLDEIHDRLSFEALSTDLVDRVRESSGDIGRTVVRGVKDNPLPLALTAVGLAWLIASQRGSSRSDDPYERVASTPASARWDRPSSPSASEWRHPSAVDEPAHLYDAAGRPMTQDDSRWGRARGAVSDARHAAEDSVRRGGRQVSAGALAAADEARSGLHSAGAAARSSASGVSDAVRRRARGAYASAAELRDRIADGTENLSETARKRVIAARTRAYEAQLRAEHYAGRGRQKAADFFDEQPIVAGALALAVGAAIGGLLPRTNREDAAFGDYRDRVFEEAERVYREERDKLEAVARETSSEARSVARDVASEVKEDLRKGADTTGDIARAKFAEAENKTKDAVNQVAETAKTEADKRKLGQI
jgi:hypothetical protein